MSKDWIIVIIFYALLGLRVVVAVHQARSGDPFYEVVVGMRNAFGKIWVQIRRLWPRRRTPRSRYDERKIAALEEECRDSSLQAFIDWIDRELAAEEAFRRPKQVQHFGPAYWGLSSENEYDQCEREYGSC